MTLTPEIPRGSNRHMIRSTAIVGVLLVLSACGPEYDPLTREGLWHPEHDNRANLVLQVANPSDLVRGTGTVSSDGQLASAAVDRLRNDKVKKLPAADISQLAVGSSGQNNSGGSGAP